MGKALGALLIGTLAIVSPATANHAFNPGPYESRGECEAVRADLSNNDRWLLEANPHLFSSWGEVRSFLNRAFTCEIDETDGNWYLEDHRAEVLASEWFLRRQ
jgi:hypothetical protein